MGSERWHWKVLHGGQEWAGVGRGACLGEMALAREVLARWAGVSRGMHVFAPLACSRARGIQSCKGYTLIGSLGPGRWQAWAWDASLTQEVMCNVAWLVLGGVAGGMSADTRRQFLEKGVDCQETYELQVCVVFCIS